MIVGISGSTGFVGQSIVNRMRGLEWTVREINRAAFALNDDDFLAREIEGADVVINLAGAPVSKKWSGTYKNEILASRIDTTRKITDAISRAVKKSAVFISASAIGIYDSINSHTESSRAYSGSFLAEVCQRWEQTAMEADASTRVVILRLGVVLGRNGGALAKMHLPFSIGLGGKIGSGNQAMSFIHLTDLVDAVIFTIENTSVKGIVNGVSPYPTTNAEFTEVLAKSLGQPAWFTVPEFALKMAFGEASVIMLEGQRVLPEKLLKEGFRFRYPTVQNALVQIYG
jgi:uncharacterized protein (TIGR01777 family)